MAVLLAASGGAGADHAPMYTANKLWTGDRTPLRGGSLIGRLRRRLT